MPFIASLMLLGSLTAAIPVALHLFFRSRYRTVPWAAMKFLLTSVEQTSRRLKFQEYLLLLLRMAVLVFLAIALARPANVSAIGVSLIVALAVLAIVTVTWVLSPLWQLTSSKLANWVIYGVTQVIMIGLCIFVLLLFGPLDIFGKSMFSTQTRGRGDSVDAVFVFDTSYSMEAADGAQNRFERAKAEAVKIIDELPPHSTVRIVTCGGKTKQVIEQRSPGNLDQAKSIIEKDLTLTSLGTDLGVGVSEAQAVLELGHAANKELYIFSDMQKLGFEQQSGALKKTLSEIKEKATVHFVRCGDPERKVKNVAIVGLTPQTGVPRPKERIGFAVLIRNSSSEAIENLRVTLEVDGNDKLGEQLTVPSIGPNRTHAVTLTGELKEAGLRVLTAKLKSDDLEGDNRYDQVILVRKQVNILVVDGKPNDKEPEKASSFYLMHSLLPVKETERATYKYNPRMVPARLATPALLKDQDICILVNCAIKGKAGTDPISGLFLAGVAAQVRTKGMGLVIFSGDNVNAADYNLGLGTNSLLPFPIKQVVKPADKKPFYIDRQSFTAAPPAYWIFKDDEKYYKDIDKVEIWQHFGLDEAGFRKEDRGLTTGGENPPNVLLRANTGAPLVVSQKIDAGEVMFVATSAHDEGLDPKTGNANWSDLGTAPEFIPFMDVTVNNLLHQQTQTYNLTAGQTLTWYPQDKHDHAYYLLHPDGKRVDPLGTPLKLDKRLLVTANDLPRAGIYRMATLPRDADANQAINPADAAVKGTPIAVIPDLTESADLTALSKDQINKMLDFEPIHIVAGQAQGALSNADRINREWTEWALLAVLALVIGEVALAWWCGRAW